MNNKNKEQKVDSFALFCYNISIKIKGVTDMTLLGGLNYV